ncbi:MAG: hypothetical protein ABUK20_00665 [Anaerolineales bacterium]
MKAIQKIIITLLILSIVLGVFVLLAMPSSTRVKQTNRPSTGVAWLDVCAILETDQMGILTPTKAHTPL